REIEPLNPMNHALSSHARFLARDFTAAVPFARQAIVIDPEFWIGRFLLAQAAERLGNHELALEEPGRAARLSGGNRNAVALLGSLLAQLGRADEARDLRATLESLSRSPYVPPVALALVSVGLGDRPAAYAWLERALDSRDVHVVYLPVDAKWDALRGEARFRALLKRCGFRTDRMAPPPTTPRRAPPPPRPPP